MRYYLESIDNRFHIDTESFCKTLNDIDQLDLPFWYDIVQDTDQHAEMDRLYPYFEEGSRSHFCMIPIDDEVITEFRESGTEIRNIQ